MDTEQQRDQGDQKRGQELLLSGEQQQLLPAQHHHHSTAAADKKYKFGPFHRVRSPTQSDDTAQLQVASQELWGRPRRGSDIPQVQSYVGPLPPSPERGIEFYASVAPDRNVAPGQARWTGPREGVAILDAFARISVVITKNTQTVSLSDDGVSDDTAVTAIDTGHITGVGEEDYVMVA